MGELTIRRNRGFTAPTRQEAVKSAKQSSSASKAQKAAVSTGITVSESVRQKGSAQSASQVRESRRALQSGEAVLAEVQDSLSRMEELAKKAAGEGGDIDRDALQAEMDLIQESIDRMMNQSGDMQMFADDGLDLPDWLAKGLLENTLSANQLLGALGLDQSASGAELLAAIANHPEGGSTAAGYLASLYLGAVIAGGGTENLDPETAMDGLRQLMDKVAEGVPLDEAIKELTNGEFTSIEDFQNQFAEGTAPGMEDFLSNLLLGDAGLSALAMPDLSLLDFLSGMEGMNFDLLMGLLSAGDTTEFVPELDIANASADASGGAAASAEANAAEPSGASAASAVAVQMGSVQVEGKDLSGVSFNASTGVVMVAGSADVTIRGMGQEPQAIQITGSGTVTLEDVNASTVAVDAPEARVFSAGQSRLAQVQLKEGSVLTLGGNGLLRVEAFRGNDTNVLRLQSGAVVIPGKNGEGLGRLDIPVVIEGPASLAAQAANVRNAAGKPMEPMDVFWKTLFPGFSAVSAMEMNGKQARMSLMGGHNADFARLWMEKGDLSSHGYPIYTLSVRGKDAAGQAKTRYTYLYWNQQTRRFETAAMYPNPFDVTGGKAGQDWVYEEDTCTLRILSGQVVSVSGGVGIDARQEPFSGRIALADGIGAMELTLNGVVCRVTSGQAFHLGRENDVTLLLESGSSNFFESGEGFAGISMGEGTSLRIDCPTAGGKKAAGTLTAAGGSGGVGIGRDRGSAERIGPVLLRGGSRFGAGALGDVRSITIAGGTVTTSGGKKPTGQKKRWVQRSVSLQLGEYTAILPQFRLSSSVLQLNKLRVSTREYAQAAMMTIDSDRRWVSQIQTAYGTLYRQLDDTVREDTEANALLEEVRKSIPQQAAQAMKAQRDSIRRLLG